MLDVTVFRNPPLQRREPHSITVRPSSPLMGVMFLLTTYMQSVLGLSAFDTGLRFIPIAIGVIAVSPVAAKATTKLGARITTATGLLVVAAGMGFSRPSASAPPTSTSGWCSSSSPPGSPLP